MRWEPDDQVTRRERIEAAHPEWEIIPPDSVRSFARGEDYWRAVGPRGRFIRAYELRDLLDQIEQPE